MSRIFHYYYIGDEAPDPLGEELGAPVLLTFSQIENDRGGRPEPHAHLYTELFLFTAGQGYFSAGGADVPLKAGDVLVVGAERKHRQFSAEEQTPLTYFCFTGAVWPGGTQRPRPLGEAGYALLHGSEDLMPLVEACKAELDGKKAGCHAAANAYFKLLLIKIARRLVPAPSAPLPPLMADIKTYIERHFDEAVTLDDLSGRFYVNKSSLLHAFKAAFGTSPIRYLNAYRIERAKAYLREDARVTEAALAAGFSNPVYFAEMFRRQTGLTPSGFKKLVRRAPAPPPSERER